MRDLPIRAGLAATVVLAASFVAVAVASSWPALAHGAAGPWIRAGFAPLCHQDSARSLAPGGEPMAVCARCAGLYGGGLVGLALGSLAALRHRRTPSAVGLIAATAPTAIDALLPWLGLPQLGNLARALVAFPAGAAAGLFLAFGVCDALTMIRSERERRWPRAAAVSGPEENDG